LGIDFGTAGIKDTLNEEEKVQDLLQTFVGSEAYMSPERLLVTTRQKKFLK